MKLSSWNTKFCWQDQHKLIKVDITSCDWQWWWLGLQSRETCRRHWRGSVQAVRRRTQDTSLSKISDNYDGVEIIEHCKSHSDSKQAYGLSQLCTQQAQGKCRSIAASSSITPSHCSVLVLTINDFHSASAFGIPLGVFDMPNPNRFDILSISIFCKIPLSISISIFFKLSLSISISISIFSKFLYRYFDRYQYFPNFLIDIFSISIFSK